MGWKVLECLIEEIMRDHLESEKKMRHRIRKMSFEDGDIEVIVLDNKISNDFNVYEM